MNFETFLVGVEIPTNTPLIFDEKLVKQSISISEAS